MRDYNRITVTGHIGRGRDGKPAVDFHETPTGQSVAHFSVASSRPVRDESEQSGWRDETEWFSVVAWAELAERCTDSLETGFHVMVEGRIQTRKWTDRDGNPRSTTEVIAQDVLVLSSKAERERIAASRTSDAPILVGTQGGAESAAPTREDAVA